MPKAPRMPSTPMRVRDRGSDVGGKGTRSVSAKGDHSSGVGGRRVAGPAAPSGSVAKKPRGKRVMMPGGQKAYHGR